MRLEGQGLKSGQPTPPDSVDELILDELRVEPRATSKSIAEKLTLNEVTVANRIRAMEQKNLMRVIAQVEYRALGYNVLALVDVMVANRKIDAVAQALASLEEVGSVVLMLGDPAIIIQVHAADLEGLKRLLVEKIAVIPGVQRFETNLILDIAKWQAESAGLHPTVP